MIRFATAVAVLLASLGGCAPGREPEVRFTAPPSTPSPSHDERADGRLPGLTLPPLGERGSPLRLSAISGKPTVVNTWASWCGPCRTELPFLARAAEVYAGRVDFLGVNVADPDTDAALALLRKTGVAYRQVVDLHAKTRVPLAYTGGLPSTVFVDERGRIVGEERTWFRSYADVAAAIRRHLGVAP